MNKNMKEVTIPVKTVEHFAVRLDSMLDTEKKLISLLREESELKKRHRAYLHVREKIDATVCEAEKQFKELAYDIGEVMEGISEKEDDCESCPCRSCKNNCESCHDSPCCEDEDDLLEAEDDDFPFAEADDEHVSSGYLFKDNDLVLMTKADFDKMLDDVLSLSELVEMVTELRCEDLDFIHRNAKRFPSFASFERDRLDLYKDAHFEAEEIMNRWDNADFGEVHGMTVELD